MTKSKFVNALIEWIDTNANHNLKIDDVAKKSGYSKWHLQRLFSQYTGTTLGQYIRVKRVTLAAQDLLMTNETVIQISVKYGFESQQSFTRAFHRYFEVPPGKFRKINRKKLECK
ncbi:helix-turn-helix domain-containing protein [Pantoea anthophila]|uniref:Helix-turn-helix domain-containing protein n=1 Tax=Pantoea anthophila TaxID=470931 RepID=A0ABY2ZHI9_9GAMM|nr:helix-turn-helix domain-containing protein [Pantoea anthophila]TPV33011.1 helix-turn-helix domain-containing protein [Pantoea anthophila]